jgi:hypothetical protein
VSSDEWLIQTGSELLAQVVNVRPLFLVELDITDDQVEDLYHHIARSRPIWTPEARMCLAVAAVQAASRANQDEDSFRELFFDRLKRPFDQHEWENSYGPTIRSCLEQHFSVELPASGRPHCYVGAVYRHAGIPAPARPSFGNLLADLLRSGVVFTRGQYDASLPTITSTVARRFLESDAGYDFTQRAARLILRIDDGRLSVEELDTLPSYQRGLFSDVLRRIREMGGPPRPVGRVGVAPFPVPRLALDRDARQLILQFHPKGVAAGAYKLETEPVLYPNLRSPGAEPPRGYFVKPSWHPWRVEKWWCPGQSPSALFRTSDGAFVTDSGEVSCGFYHLVTRIPDRVPTSMVHVEGANLDQEESADYYSILEIEISRGDDLSDLGFSVRESAALPSFRFPANGRSHPLGLNVFASFLPEIEILNWTPDFARKYWIWVDDGSGERRVAINPDSNRIRVSTTCPSQCEIWLEPKAHGHVVDRLTFSIVPRELSIAFVESCAAVDASVHIRARLPERWEISWRPSLERCGPDLWQVPAHQSLVEGTVGCGGFRQFFSLRVTRASMRLRSESGHCTILWKEHLDKPVGVAVEGLPNTRCSIALEVDGVKQTVCPLGLLPPSGATQLTSHQFRDALKTCGLAAAEFAIQLTGHSSFRTGRYFASSKAIIADLAELSPRSEVFKLPGLGEALEEATTLIDSPQRTLALPGALNATPLRGFLCGLAYGAAKLEGTSVYGGIEQFAGHAPESMKAVIAWVADARAPETSLDARSTVLAAYPAEAVGKLPITRWKELAEALHRQIAADLDLPRLIGEWRRAVVDNRYGRAESELARRRGGGELTEAAQRYLIAFSESEYDRLEILADSCALLRRVAEASDSDLVVRLVAPALLQLAYYHSDHREAAANISLPDLPTGLQRLVASMRALAARCRGRSFEVEWRTGLGFAEISPRHEDADLEASLGRQ